MHSWCHAANTFYVLRTSRKCWRNLRCNLCAELKPNAQRKTELNWMIVQFSSVEFSSVFCCALNRRRPSQVLDSQEPATVGLYGFRLTTDIGLIFRWDQRLRPNGSTLVSAGVEFNQSPQPVIADVIGNSSLISPYSFVYLRISKKVEWFSLIRT